MAFYIGKSYTLRYQLPYNKVPTVKAPFYGSSILRYVNGDYGCILDAVYEMVDMVATGNGVSIENAMNTVMRDESLYILPSHREMICATLKE